ncbi:tetratricopeptide repeat protein [Maribacter sp. 2308TA10-17]|uniref:tetratricopeptide repeat protein n=1 Tax=Maribacter sp. 2308TA10-17 TaxID=3386276 RepID=UPI0039BC5D4E
MKLFLKILKIGFSSFFLIFILVVVYFVFLAPKETRFMLAGPQGSLLSQKMFNQLKGEYPDYSKVYFEQSVAWNKYGNFAKGFELLDQAVERDPALHLGYRGWMKLRKLRAYDNALEDFDRLDKLTPDVVDAPWGENIDFLRGECYYGKKEYSKAIEAFNRTIANEKEDWADPQTFVYLGLCQYQLGNYEKAISEFKRALAQSASICEAHFGLAQTYLKIGNVELAKTHLKKTEESMVYKRDDEYNEYLNEIYLWEVLEFKEQLERIPLADAAL